MASKGSISTGFSRLHGVDDVLPPSRPPPPPPPRPRPRPRPRMFFFSLSFLSDHVIACHFHTAEGGGGGGGGVGELNGGWVAGVGWAMLWVSDGIQRV